MDLLHLNVISMAMVVLCIVPVTTMTTMATTTGKEGTTQPTWKHQGNILVLSMQGYSRWLSMLSITRELEKFGYKSTFVFPDDQQAAKFKDEFEVDVIVSDGMTKFEEYIRDTYVSLLQCGLRGSTTPISLLQNFAKYCPLVAGDKNLMQTLHTRHFDLVIIDTIFVTPCINVIPYKLSVPFIQYGLIIELQHVRSLVHPSSSPVHRAIPIADKMTYLERISNALIYLSLLILPDGFNPSDIVGTFAPEKPHLTNEELKAKTELYLLESDELMDYDLPTYPNMILVGGVATHPGAALTGTLKSFMDSAMDGAVIVTFGSHVSAMPDHIMDTLMQGFSMKSNLKFVLRYGLNKTNINGNVLIMPWLPQNDILAHRNTRLFISHCGSNSRFEALYHAVPTLCLPLFGDQPLNARVMHKKGYGLSIDISILKADEFASAINDILNNPSYQHNITKASKIFKSRHMKPAQRAAWWIDHVIKYGGQHLHPAVVDLPYYQFLLLDVFAGFVIVFIVLCLMCCAVFRCIRQFAFRRVKLKSD